MSSGNVVVLLSGGIDSLVLAELARRDGRLVGVVFVDYGHPALIAETWRAFQWAAQAGVPLRAPHVRDLNLGEMGTEQGARVVPARNLLLLSLAANVAAEWGAAEVWLGATLTDAEAYPDCRAAFFDALNVDALQAATGVRFVAPLVNATKQQVVTLARHFELDDDASWSCYGPGPEPCGVCPSCVELDAARASAQRLEDALTRWRDGGAP